MKSLSQCTGQEALTTALSLFARSTLVESSPAMGHMYRALEYIAKGANAAACRSYHDAVSCMLKTDAIHISGSLWKDEILHTLVMTDNTFATDFSNGGSHAKLDIFKEELQTLSSLAQLGTKTIVSMIKEAPQHKGQRDNISVMSAAVWAGGQTKPLAKMEAEEKGKDNINIPVAFTPLEYSDTQSDRRLFDTFVSGNALEELYARLIEEEDWEKLVFDFADFYLAYGTGKFLKDRVFRARGFELLPVSESLFTSIVPLTMYERQHVALMENTIRFMRGEKAQRILLTGESGVGKTANVASLINELPELRFILAGDRDMENLPEIIAEIEKQPLKFLLLLDDIDVNGDEFRTFAYRTMGFKTLTDNILLYATARKGTNGAFAQTLHFPYPNPQQFEVLISEFLENDGVTATKQAIHNAAVDHQVDAREKLTVTGAIAVSEKLKA